MNRGVRFFISVIFLFLLISGCQIIDETGKKPSEMNEEELPEVRSLQHEFTRKFIQSVEEVEDGYYPFLSGTGKYKMLFPAEGFIHGKRYGIEKDFYEGFLVSLKNKNDMISQIKVDYYGDETVEDSSISLKYLAGRVGQELDFTKLDLETTEVHYAPISFEDNIFGVAAYIQNKKGSGGIEIVYDTDCDADQLDCAAFRQEEEKRIIHWIRSIEFIDEADSLDEGDVDE